MTMSSEQLYSEVVFMATEVIGSVEGKESW